jgi:hypothetical protein
MPRHWCRTRSHDKEIAVASFSIAVTDRVLSGAPRPTGGCGSCDARAVPAPAADEETLRRDPAVDVSLSPLSD